MPNQLAGQTSPYLLQHADNPVPWYPWGEEALRIAREEDKPIFLSIGYSACHWCHVMAHESFEDAEIARLLAEHFVSIKVDREERPDLDQIYMEAVTAMTGHGGWPMSVFLAPSLEPFFGGTYWPPQSRAGVPGFAQVLAAVADAMQRLRDDDRTIQRVIDAVCEHSDMPLLVVVEKQTRCCDALKQLEAKTITSAEQATKAAEDCARVGIAYQKLFGAVTVVEDYL